MEIVENFLQLVDIDEIVTTEEYVNMVDITVEIDNSFLLSNGIVSHNSASSAFRKFRGPNTMGSFSLKGKFINVSDITTQKLSQNEEAVNLMAAIGLKFGMEPDLKHLRYGRILILSDADVDGNSISALLINFFNKYWPSLFDRKMIYKVETPIVVATNIKDKKNRLPL